MEEKIQEFLQLRDRSQRILDGSYQRNLLYRLNDEESHLDKFYKDMKKKFKETKLKIKAFTSDELSDTVREQLNALFAKSVPVKFGRNDRPQDMQQQLKSVKKQIHNANTVMYSLPNYIEIAVDPKFINLLTYNSDPIVIRGRPKYMAQVSTDDEMEVIDDADDFSETEEDLNKQHVKTEEERKGRSYMVGRNPNTSRSAPEREPHILANGDDNEALAYSGVLKWYNNAPAFSMSASGTILHRSP